MSLSAEQAWNSEKFRVVEKSLGPEVNKIVNACQVVFN